MSIKASPILIFNNILTNHAVIYLRIYCPHFKFDLFLDSSFTQNEHTKLKENNSLSQNNSIFTLRQVLRNYLEDTKTLFFHIPRSDFKISLMCSLFANFKSTTYKKNTKYHNHFRFRCYSASCCQCRYFIFWYTG